MIIQVTQLKVQSSFDGWYRANKNKEKENKIKSSQGTRLDIH